MKCFLIQGKYIVGILKKYDRMQIHHDGFKKRDDDSDETNHS
jgi:hypothetical protein